MREQRTQAVTALVDTRFDWAHVFHEIGRVLPDGVSISSLTVTVGTAGSGSSSSSSSSSASAGASVASATPPGSVPTSRSAAARSHSRKFGMLTRLRQMDGVSQVTLQSSVKGAPGSAVGRPAATPARRTHPCSLPDRLRPAARAAGERRLEPRPLRRSRTGAASSRPEARPAMSGRDRIALMGIVVLRRSARPGCSSSRPSARRRRSSARRSPPRDASSRPQKANWRARAREGRVPDRVRRDREPRQSGARERRSAVADLPARAGDQEEDVGFASITAGAAGGAGISTKTISAVEAEGSSRYP